MTAITIIRAGLVAAMALASGAAVAQPSTDPFAGFKGELAPGYQQPGEETLVPVRDSLQPLGTLPNSDYLDTNNDTPINEFAGQTRKYDPGLIGGFLGAAKDRMLGRR